MCYNTNCIPLGWITSFKIKLCKFVKIPINQKFTLTRKKVIVKTEKYEKKF